MFVIVFVVCRHYHEIRNWLEPLGFFSADIFLSHLNRLRRRRPRTCLYMLV